MKIDELVQQWHRREGGATARIGVELAVEDAARLAALAALYPGKGEAEIVRELLHSALDEVERALPYVPGPAVVAEDELGDPIFEDIGPIPRFHRLKDELLRKLVSCRS